MLAEGRLNLSAAALLAPRLTHENASKLLEAAALKTRSEVEHLLARSFPSSEALPLVQVVAASRPRDGQLSPGIVDAGAGEVPAPLDPPADPGALGHVEPPAPRASVKPHAAERYTVQFSMGQATHDKLRHAQALLGHRLPSGDLAAVFDCALDALIGQLEKRKCAATARPRRAAARASAHPRYVPAHVKRAVWARDGGRCTFVGAGGRRCAARKFLEYDHVEPVACGGRATVENVRLRCRGHNQFEAEGAFGADFMKAKRAASREARADAVARQMTQDLILSLTTLGFRAGEARRAAECCPGDRLEERVRASLKFLCPRARVVGRVRTVVGARVWSA